MRYVSSPRELIGGWTLVEDDGLWALRIDTGASDEPIYKVRYRHPSGLRVSGIGSTPHLAMGRAIDAVLTYEKGKRN